MGISHPFSQTSAINSPLGPLTSPDKVDSTRQEHFSVAQTSNPIRKQLIIDWCCGKNPLVGMDSSDHRDSQLAKVLRICDGEWPVINRTPVSSSLRLGDHFWRGSRELEEEGTSVEC